MSAIFEGTAIYEAIASLIVAFAFALFFHILCRLQHLGKNNLKDAPGQVEKISKALGALGKGLEKRNLERRNAKKQLVQIRFYARNTASVLEVFLFEDGGDYGISSAVSSLRAMEGQCDSFARAYNTSDSEGQRTALRRMEEITGEVKATLLSEIQERESRKLLAL